MSEDHYFRDTEINNISTSQIIKRYKNNREEMIQKSLDEDTKEFLILNILKVEDIAESNSTKPPSEIKLKKEDESGDAIVDSTSVLEMNNYCTKNIIKKHNKNVGMLDDTYLNSYKDIEAPNIVKIKEEIVENCPLIESDEIILESDDKSQIFIDCLKLRPKISKEKKEILINLHKSGMPVVKAAAAVGIKNSTANTIIKRYKEDGEKFFTKRWGGHRKKLRTQKVLETIKEIVETNPSITLHKIQKELIEKNISLSKTSIHTALSHDLEELIDRRKKHRASKILKIKDEGIIERNSHAKGNEKNLEINRKGNPSISNEKKEILINLYESGIPIVKAANAMKINCNTAHSIIRRHRKEGVVASKLWVCNNKKFKVVKKLETKEKNDACQSPKKKSKTLFESVEKVEGRLNITKEQKQRLINLYRSGTAIVNAAKIIGINCNSANSIIKRYRNDGEKLIEKRWGGHKKKSQAANMLKTEEEKVENHLPITEDQIEFQLDVKGRQSISNTKKMMLIDLYKSGTSIVDAANYVGIKCNSANSIIRRYKKDGEEFIVKRWGGHRKRLRTQEVLKTIEEMVKTDPSITLHKIQMELIQKGISLSKSSIHKALNDDLGISTKLVRCRMESCT